MGNTSRPGRTERRRDRLKERKAERRVQRQQGKQPQDSHNMQLSMKVIALVPESLRDAAIERFMQRAEAAETVRGLPPGFGIQQTPQGVWQVLPPSEHNMSVLIKGLTHVVPELATAFAWEVADGKVDIDASKAVASQVIASLIERGEIPSAGPEEDETRIKILGLLLAGELITGYQSAILKFGGNFSPVHPS
jgi:hypothetical protein